MKDTEDKIVSEPLAGESKGGRSLGDMLRSAREAQGVALRTISEETRISLRYLEAIEADDYKKLPGGVFNRSFVRSYAKHIGLDEDEALAAYLRTTKSQGNPIDEEPRLPQKAQVYSNEIPSSITTPLLTVGIALALAVVTYGILRLSSYMKERNAVAVATSPTPLPSVAATPTATPTITVSPAKPLVASTVPSPAASGTPLPTFSPVPALSPGTQLPPPGPNEFRVSIKANSDVWLRTFAEDGRSVERTLKPGEVIEFNITNKLRAQYARVLAGALEMTVNGRNVSVPTESLSRTGPAKTLSGIEITKENFQQLP